MNIIVNSNDDVGKNVIPKLDSVKVVNDFLDFDLKSDLNLVISKHESTSKISCFSAHSTGNFSKAKFGGKDFSLSISNAIIQSNCFLKLKELIKDNHLKQSVVLEATHHGPSIDSPVLFVEVGSTPSEWNNELYIDILITASKYVKDNYESLMKTNPEVTIAIGGGHYAHSFSKKVSKDLVIGHICPNYQLENLDFEMFSQMVKKTIPTPSKVLFSKNIDYSKYIKFAKKLNLNYEVV